MQLLFKKGAILIDENIGDDLLKSNKLQNKQQMLKIHELFSGDLNLMCVELNLEKTDNVKIANYLSIANLLDDVYFVNEDIYLYDLKREKTAEYSFCGTDIVDNFDWYKYIGNGKDFNVNVVKKNF